MEKALLRLLLFVLWPVIAAVSLVGMGAVFALLWLAIPWLNWERLERGWRFWLAKRKEKGK